MTQTLALEFPEESRRLAVATNQVRQHHHVTFSHQRKMSVMSKRIMARVLEQIQTDDLQLRDCYQVNVRKLVEGTDLAVNNCYTWAKAALVELEQVRWSFEDLENKLFYQRSLLVQDAGRPSFVHDGTAYIRLNPALGPYFLELAGEYTLYKLDGYMKLRSWYAMRFFEILSHFKDTGWWEVSIEEYRKLMDCAPEVDKLGKPVLDKAGKPKMKHQKITHLVTDTIEVAQRELADTPYAFTYSLKESSGTRGRARVVGFSFELVTKQSTRIPANWVTNPLTGPIIARLRAYQVSEKNMALYLKAITLEGVRKLLTEWDNMKVGPKAINDPLKYCNATIVRVGKAAIEAKAAEQRELRREAKNIAQSLFPGASSVPEPTSLLGPGATPAG
jgi:hypothetical protein